MFKRVLIILIVLNVVGFTLLSVLRSNKASKVEKQTVADLATAAKVQRNGFMGADQYSKVMSIGDKANASGEMNEEDTAYLIGLLSAEPEKNTQPGFVHLHVLAALACVKKPTPGQAEKIVQASMPLLSSKDVRDQRGAIEVMTVMKVPQAVPYILPLVNSPKENVRSSAKKYLEVVGYKQGA